MARKPRIAVVGLGTMGSQTAWRLSARGAEVVGFEQFAPGHDRGAAGGETRIFRSAHFEDSRYVPLLKLADTLWTGLEQETERSLRHLTGCLLLGPADDSQLCRAISSVREHGLDHELLSKAEFTTRYPQLALDDSELALLDCRGGYIHSGLTVLAAARRAEQLGATIHRYSPVRDITTTRSGVRISTDAHTVDADKVVISAGPWVGRLLPGFSQSVQVLRPVSVWFPPLHHGWFGPESPTFIRTAPRHFYGVPAPDGMLVKVGLSAVAHRAVEDPNVLDRTVDLDELQVFKDTVKRYIPGLISDPIRVGTYMEAYSRDRHPVVGLLPADPRVVVLAAFSGHGFKLSPAMGEIATDLALTGTTEHPINIFAPNRLVKATS